MHESAGAGREEGYRDGYAEGSTAGRAAGLQEGLQSARGEIDGQLQRLAGILSNLLAPVEAQHETLKAALSRLVIRVAREVVRSELKTDPALILKLVTEALEAMPAGASNLRVFLNPDDVELMREHGDRLALEGVLLNVDADLLPGDCRVESAESLIEWSTEGRLSTLSKELFGNAE